MTKGSFDWKTMTLVGLALVAGLLGARSMISSVDGRGDQGFGESTITPITSDEPAAEPLIWTPPIDPRNPFQMTEGFETPTVIVEDADGEPLDEQVSDDQISNDDGLAEDEEPQPAETSEP